MGDEAAGRVPSAGPPVQKSFHDWLEALNAESGHRIVIRDFDGLDRADFEHAYRGTPMTEQEFQQRLGRCTFNIKAGTSSDRGGGMDITRVRR